MYNPSCVNISQCAEHTPEVGLDTFQRQCAVEDLRIQSRFEILQLGYSAYTYPKVVILVVRHNGNNLIMLPERSD